MVTSPNASGPATKGYRIRATPNDGRTIIEVVSGGRIEAGVGRSCQPRESEIPGKPYGSSIQDQERNRVALGPPQNN